VIDDEDAEAWLTHPPTCCRIVPRGEPAGWPRSPALTPKHASALGRRHPARRALWAARRDTDSVRRVGLSVDKQRGLACAISLQ
jgi:hypothetical protein